MIKFILYVAIFLVAIGGAYYFFGIPSVIGPVAYKDLLRVDTPVSGELVTSPLTITGMARGMWYFEASFPIKLIDADGTEIVVVPAQAQGEWMTEDFVPFLATLTFPKPKTKTGVLLFVKDNPSGLPEHDDSFSIPVRFQ